MFGFILFFFFRIVCNLRYYNFAFFRWIGAPLKQQLNTLKPVQVTELETEFNNLKGEKVAPTRYLKSQKPKVACVVDSADGDVEGQ